MKNLFLFFSLFCLSNLSAQRKIVVNDDIFFVIPQNFVEIPLNPNAVPDSKSEFELVQRKFGFVNPEKENEFLFIDLNKVKGVDYFDNNSKNPIVINATQQMFDDKMKEILESNYSGYEILEKTKVVKINNLNAFQSVATVKESTTNGIVNLKIFFINILYKNELINLQITLNSGDGDNMSVKKEEILKTLYTTAND